MLIYGCQSVLSDFSPHKMRKPHMYWPILFLFNINSHCSLKAVSCYVSCAEVSTKMFLRCSRWILPYCYVVAWDSGWLPQRWYMVGKVLRVDFLRLSLHLCDFSPALWTYRWKCCIGSIIKIIPHFFSTRHMIWGMIHVWSYILSVRGLLKSIDLEFLSMHVIFWLTSISQNGHTDMLHTPKYAFLSFVK